MHLLPQAHCASTATTSCAFGATRGAVVVHTSVHASMNLAASNAHDLRACVHACAATPSLQSLRLHGVRASGVRRNPLASLWQGHRPWDPNAPELRARHHALHMDFVSLLTRLTQLSTLELSHVLGDARALPLFALPQLASISMRADSAEQGLVQAVFAAHGQPCSDWQRLHQNLTKLTSLELHLVWKNGDMRQPGFPEHHQMQTWVACLPQLRHVSGIHIVHLGQLALWQSASKLTHVALTGPVQQPGVLVPDDEPVNLATIPPACSGVRQDMRTPAAIATSTLQTTISHSRTSENT